ncbi:hypothetical protein ITP53_11300 [Nonomuraea sp. K274]|uniref:Uncharacterized protein n=1 Tax=Nonomuraea cypriaca TaxID=1187855 RepID=A0A931A7Y3_9ACTN|nr:hypothetical protein [Nonomuraea cypriaca]MBF8186324.1 hypothetical protein [Nonomuraea cypriaca]
MARVYATADDLTDWTGDDPPADADRLLARASRLIDNRLLLTAVYPVDPAGMPTEPEHADALRDAACALVEWWDDHGDDGTGAGGDYTNVSAGGISFSRATGSSGTPSDPRIAPEAVEILGGAGLLRHGVGTWRP